MPHYNCLQLAFRPYQVQHILLYLGREEVVFSIILLGVAGYMVLSNYSFVDALYMTVITITTVGFGEVKPFTPEEKIFTVILILTSISVFGYAVSTFSEYLVSGKLFEHYCYKHKN